MRDVTAATLDLDRDVLSDTAIQNARERDKLGDEFIVEANQDVTWLDFSVGRGFPNDLSYGQHARLIRIHGTSQVLRFGGQAKAA